MGGDEGSRPASADSGLTQPARMESDEATLESSSIQAKMQPEDHQEDKSGGGRASATLAAPEAWPSCQLGPPRASSLPQSPAWPEPAAVPGLLPQTLEQLLERQWDQGSTFLMRQAQHFDIASLLSCLHQLRSENLELESRISGLQARRDQLLAVSARLMGPLGGGGAGGSAPPPPLGVPSTASPPVPPHHPAAFGSRPAGLQASLGGSIERHPGFPLGFPSPAQPPADAPHQAAEPATHGFPGRPAMGGPHPEGTPEGSSHRGGSTLAAAGPSSRQPSNS